MPKIINKCSFCGSIEKTFFNSAYGDYLCSKHSMQYYHTKMLTKNFKKEKNKYEIKEGFAEIILLNMGKIEIARTKVDIEDLEECLKYKWGLHKEGYAYNAVVGSLSNYLMKIEDKKFLADHKNGIRLDNRRNNLRKVTYSKNGMNTSIPSNNTSGTKGVSFNRNRWQAYITVNKKVIKLGNFKNVDDAIRARKDAEKKFFKEYSFDRSRNGNI